MKQFVKQWWTTRCGRFMRLFAKADEGSGTVSGITLIAATAVMLGVVAAAGNLLICLHRAQHVADLAAVASAPALHEGSAVPCEVASRTTRGNGAELRNHRRRCTNHSRSGYERAVCVSGEQILPCRAGRMRVGVRLARMPVAVMQ